MMENRIKKTGNSKIRLVSLQINNEMKTKNKLFALLSVILPLAITGCDNDAPSTI